MATAPLVARTLILTTTLIFCSACSAEAAADEAASDEVEVSASARHTRRQKFNGTRFVPRTEVAMTLVLRGGAAGPAHRYGRLRLDEVQDDEGRALSLVSSGTSDAIDRGMRARVSSLEARDLWIYFSLEGSDSKSKQIVLIEGKIDLLVAGGSRAVEFPIKKLKVHPRKPTTGLKLPKGQADRQLRKAGLTIYADMYDSMYEESKVVDIRLTGKTEQLERVRWIDLIDEEGNAIEFDESLSQGHGIESAHPVYNCQLTLEQLKESGAKKVRITLVEDIETVTVPFKLTDVVIR